MDFLHQAFVVISFGIKLVSRLVINVCPIILDFSTSAKIKDYWANIYHKPTDQLYPETDNYEGLMQEVHLFFDLAYELTTTDVYPEWRPTSEFANIR